MTRDARHDVLFEPVRIGPRTLKNRFYQVPHCTGFGVVKPLSQAYHRGMKAEGGWAAVCTEYCAISPETDDAPEVCARLWDDTDVAALALLCDQAHEHGALAGVELFHGGSTVKLRETRLPPLGPSQLANPHEHLSIPKAMTLADIRRVQTQWVAAARRARSAGFDIVYVYGAHSYLPTQFLSPFYNHRSDQYGGSLENRSRFWLETIELVREAIGDDCAIAVRIAADTLEQSGVELAEGLEFVSSADHLVDLWDITVGGSAREVRTDSGASRFFAHGYQLKWSGQVRAATAKPVVGVGRLVEPDHMAEIVRAGTLDLIGAARASISDPFLPQKIDEGRADDVRICIGCNACYSRAVWGRHIGCTQNPTAGEEYRRGWHPERFAPAANADQRVLVVGAGVAGLECALVLGRRGMRRVELVDARSGVGGSASWICRLPGLAEWGGLVSHRTTQLGKLENVAVTTGVKLDAAAVCEVGAEIVVVATGAHWSLDGLSPFTHEPLPGAAEHRERVLTPEQIMIEGSRPQGSSVLVYDCEGYFMGASLAELLACEGYAVEIVTPHPVVAPVCDETIEGFRLRRRLHEVGVGTRVGTAVAAIDADAVELTDEFGERSERRPDAVVLVTQRVSNDALQLDLESDRSRLEAAGIRHLYRIGDAVAPRLLADAIFDGHRLGREIDSADPAIALDFARERPGQQLSA